MQFYFKLYYMNIKLLTELYYMNIVFKKCNLLSQLNENAQNIVVFLKLIMNFDLMFYIHF